MIGPSPNFAFSLKIFQYREGPCARAIYPFVIINLLIIRRIYRILQWGDFLDNWPVLRSQRHSFQKLDVTIRHFLRNRGRREIRKSSDSDLSSAIVDGGIASLSENRPRRPFQSDRSRSLPFAPEQLAGVDFCRAGLG